MVSKFDAHLPDETAALSINNYCVSGLTAIGQAAGVVESGQAKSVLARGVEMMSRWLIQRPSVAQVVDDLDREYQAAIARFRSLT